MFYETTLLAYKISIWGDAKCISQAKLEFVLKTLQQSWKLLMISVSLSVCPAFPECSLVVLNYFDSIYVYSSTTPISNEACSMCTLSTVAVKTFPIHYGQWWKIVPNEF